MSNTENRIEALEIRCAALERKNEDTERGLLLLLKHLKLRVKRVHEPYELVTVNEIHARDF